MLIFELSEYDRLSAALGNNAYHFDRSILSRAPSCYIRDLGTSLKSYVQSYQSRSLAHSPSAINSITDMKKFVEEYPEFRKLGGNVSKHVALVGELSRLVEKYKLLDLGEVEQGLATSAGADLRVRKTLHQK